MLELPDFEILKKQSDAPHVAHIVAENTVPNSYGAPVRYRVRQGRNGKDWWISASLHGMRVSNTLHTSKQAKADEWIRAVKSGQVRVRDAGHATKKKDWGWQDTPDAWQRGFEFAKEAMLHETRAEMREILRKVAKSASSSYDYGFLAAYQDEFDVPRTRSHAAKAKIRVGDEVRYIGGYGNRYTVVAIHGSRATIASLNGKKHTETTAVADLWKL